MKLKLNEKGIAHYLLPALVVVLIALVGTYVLLKTHAATPTTNSFANVKTGTALFKTNPNVNFGNQTNIESQQVDQLATSGIVPPNNPSASIPPNPNFTGDGYCAYYVYINTSSCNSNAESAIDNARSSLEGLSSLNFNLSAYQSMTPTEQLFVVTNLERADRGLPPITALTTQLNAVAQSGAANFTDPYLNSYTLTGGAQVYSWGSIFAEGTVNPLGSDYFWMYYDGYPGINGDCSAPGQAGCWGHRDNILGTYMTSAICSSYPNTYMGVGYTPDSSSGYDTYAAIIVGSCGANASDVTLTWTNALKMLNGSASTPSAPQSVSAKPATVGIKLSWHNPSSNGGALITSYKIYRSQQPLNEKLYKSITKTSFCSLLTCTYTDSTATPKDTFYYEIAAVNSVGTGPVSAQVHATSP